MDKEYLLDYLRQKLSRLRGKYEVVCGTRNHAEALRIEGAIFHLETTYGWIVNQKEEEKNVQNKK